jgi:hypothetical protein
VRGLLLGCAANVAVKSGSAPCCPQKIKWKRQRCINEQNGTAAQFIFQTAAH